MKDLFGNPTANEFKASNAMNRSAVIDESGKYRYKLTRYWTLPAKMCCFVMLNPSTADAYHDDATIRRCIDFAKQWGYGGIHVGNLFAFRATKPEDLAKSDEPIGPDNKRYLKTMFDLSSIIVCAWGNGSTLRKILKGESVTNLFPLEYQFHAIQQNTDGTPSHPLYLPKNLTPKRYFI